MTRPPHEHQPELHRGGRAAWLTPAISLLIVPPSSSPAI